jgi:hypothetical protein
LSLSEWLSITSDLVVLGGGVAASVFAIYRFRKSRETEVILELLIEPREFVVGDSTYLDLAISIRNVGKTVAVVPPERIADARCWVRSVGVPDSNCVLVWDLPVGKDIVEPCAYMQAWLSHYPNEPMLFEPGTTETLHVFVSLRYVGLLWIRAELLDEDENLWRADRLLVVRRASPHDSTEGTV